MVRYFELKNKPVYDESGKFIGNMVDIVIYKDRGDIFGIVIENLSREIVEKLGISKKRGIIIPYKAVKSIRDVVIIKEGEFITPE